MPFPAPLAGDGSTVVCQPPPCCQVRSEGPQGCVGSLRNPPGLSASPATSTRTKQRGRAWKGQEQSERVAAARGTSAVDGDPTEGTGWCWSCCPGRAPRSVPSTAQYASPSSHISLTFRNKRLLRKSAEAPEMLEQKDAFPQLLGESSAGRSSWLFLCLSSGINHVR